MSAPSLPDAQETSAALIASGRAPNLTYRCPQGHAVMHGWWILDHALLHFATVKTASPAFPDDHPHNLYRASVGLPPAQVQRDERGGASWWNGRETEPQMIRWSCGHRGCTRSEDAYELGSPADVMAAVSAAFVERVHRTELLPSTA